MSSTSEGALVRTLEGHVGWVRSVAWSLDGRLLVGVRVPLCTLCALCTLLSIVAAASVDLA